MNSENMRKFLESHHVDMAPANWFSPEQFLFSADRPETLAEEQYNKNIKTAMNRDYTLCGQDMMTALCILANSSDSFKNRINGVIIDDWLTEKTFKPIAKYCVAIFNELEALKSPLEEWQLKLKKVFEGMGEE